MAHENRSRREYLAAVSAVGLAGVAGCSGNGDGDSPADTERPEDETPSDSDDNDEGGGSDGDGSDGDDGPSGDLSCTDVTNGYERQDGGSRPVIFNFEYPALFNELEFSQVGGTVIYNGNQSNDNINININLSQGPANGDSTGAVDEGGGVTTTFNGEEVEFSGYSRGNILNWSGELPYQIEGERETFLTALTLSSTDQSSNECGDALRTAAEHIVTSMEVNSETTLG